MEINIEKYLDGLSTPRRISEVMNEKGRAFSIQGMANRLGISRETFRQMLSPKRNLYDFELQKIADAMDMTLERLKQDDVRDKRKRLHYLLEVPFDEQESWPIAEELFQLARGITEKCTARIDLGRVHFKYKRYQQAHELWLQAHKEAVEIQEKYGEPQLLINVLAFLDMSCSILKDFSIEGSYLSKAAQFIEEGALINERPQLAAHNRYFLARAAEELGNYDEARKNHSESLDYYLLSQNTSAIGRHKINFGNFEFRMGNFARAEELYEDALLDLEKFDSLGKVICLKEYSRCLLTQGKNDAAEKRLHQASEVIKISLDKRVLEYAPKIDLMLARATNDPQYALNALHSGNLDIKVRGIVYKYLYNYYLTTNDAEAVVKYLRLSNELYNYQYDLLEEEEF